MLIDKLMTKLQQARLCKEKEKLIFYSTFLGDCQTALKNGEKEVSDDIILAIGKSWEKSLSEMAMRAKESHSETLLEKTNREIRLLEDLLPQKLSEAQIEQIILDYIADGLNNLGQIMKQLKEEYNGLYDGKKASEIIKTNLEYIFKKDV